MVGNRGGSQNNQYFTFSDCLGVTVGVLLSFSTVCSASSASLHLCSYALLDWENREVQGYYGTTHMDLNDGQVNHK